jgi:hypothetical protein
VKGVHLTLMIGPAVPLQVSRDVLDALTSVTVTTSTQGPTAFQLQFALRNSSPLQTMFLYSGGSPIPLVRVVVAVTVDGTTDVLVDGMMTTHQLSGSDRGMTLTVIGEDLTRAMTYIDFSGIPYPAMPDFLRVGAVLAKYAVLGIIPMPIPSVLIDVPIPTGRIPSQCGNDLEYVQALAKDAGYVFYLDPGPEIGTSTAYWGPEVRVGTPQKALNGHEMDVHANVESMNFRYEPDRASMPLLVYYNEASHVPIIIPVPNVSPLSPPLGTIPAFPLHFPPITGTAKKSPLQVALIGMAEAARSSDVLFVDGSLDVMRYGAVLKARKLVGVRGMGEALDGLYYVDRVTHNLRRGEYKQSFTLKRNGLVSTVSTVAA